MQTISVGTSALSADRDIFQSQHLLQITDRQTDRHTSRGRAIPVTEQTSLTVWP